MKTKIWLGTFGTICFLASLWLAVTGLLPALNHGRLTASAWVLWLAVILLRALKDRIWPFTGADSAANLQRAWMRFPLNVVLAFMPGLSLLWFGIFAPDEPSLTQGGLDVCALETGLCISGPRAVIVWGVLILGIGLLGLWLIWPGRVKKVEQAQGETDHAT
jgi:hypothetical protein